MSWQEMQKYGKLLDENGLVTSHSGNISVRHEHGFYITRTGSMLGQLTKHDIVWLPLEKEGHEPLASVETPSHRAIYQKTPWQAVIHSHPPNVLSLSQKNKKPDIPIVDAGIASDGQAISEALKDSPILIVKGHGVFACGQTLGEAYKLTADLEDSCKRLLHSI